jgi:hypothetical protein
MSLIVTAKSESTFKPVPEGLHLARCYRIVDLGTQESTYLGQVRTQKKLMIQFEVHGDDDKGFALITRAGEPMSISKNYTRSIGENATLRQDLTSWRNKAFTPEELEKFELENLLGVWGMISVIKTISENGKAYTNINTITPVPAAMKKNGMPQHFNEAKIFSIENPDMELFATFSDYLRAKIERSPEWQSRMKPVAYTGGGVAEFDDDVPF